MKKILSYIFGISICSAATLGGTEALKQPIVPTFNEVSINLPQEAFIGRVLSNRTVTSVEAMSIEDYNALALPNASTLPIGYQAWSERSVPANGDYVDEGDQFVINNYGAKVILPKIAPTVEDSIAELSLLNASASSTPEI